MQNEKKKKNLYFVLLIKINLRRSFGAKEILFLFLINSLGEVEWLRTPKNQIKGNNYYYKNVQNFVTSEH